MHTISECKGKAPVGIGLIRSVERPPTWRKEPYTLSYLFVQRELGADELVDLLEWAAEARMPNPRVITPDIIRWSSLFHPRFYLSVHESAPAAPEPLEWQMDGLPATLKALTRLWLQSILFLSGVTLSAAIIQRRFSAGTIASKLDRLWEAGTLASAGVAPELASLELHESVCSLAADSRNDIARLLSLRELFMHALELVAPKEGTVETMHQTTPVTFGDNRFGFADMLRKKIGSDLRAVVVYGSSVSSLQFADIDTIVVVDDPISVLSRLAGSSPIWKGKELNIGVYSPEELLVMQRLSGDNLADYGICIRGEAAVVRKPVSDLLARNLSFGVVRQRQQLGMLSRVVSSNDSQAPDRQNLYDYFAKIPANVAKGTFGAIGRRMAKEEVHAWLVSETGFDTPTIQRRAAQGYVAEALASSALVTGKTLSALNSTLSIVRQRDASSHHTTVTNRSVQQ